MSDHGGVLAFDPGAYRCGWAHVIDGWDGPWVNRSGILGVERVRNGKKVPYQEYRLSLIDYWLDQAYMLLLNAQPEAVVTEIIPVVGGGNFTVATQSDLAATALTTIQAVAKLEGYEVIQIAANTVQKNIHAGKKPPSGKISKVMVRNGVLKLIPELEARRKDFVKVFDETDAIAIGLCHLGYKVQSE